MGTDFECGCRVSGAWYLCSKHEVKLIGILDEDTNTISEVVRDKKGNITGFVNERPMKDAK